jgi:hypothetical protein
LEVYESSPVEYVAKEHAWFNHEDAEKTRVETKSFLQDLFNVQLLKIRFNK